MPRIASNAEPLTFEAYLELEEIYEDVFSA